MKIKPKLNLKRKLFPRIMTCSLKKYQMFMSLLPKEALVAQAQIIQIEMVCLGGLLKTEFRQEVLKISTIL